MDSVYFPDAFMSSGMVADGYMVYEKTITTLYEQAAGPEPTPNLKTSSRTVTIRKARDNSGKKLSTTTRVSKRSQRSGVMNRRRPEPDT